MLNLQNILDESGIISQRNIAHYDQNAVSYDEGTKDHDVSQNINAFLRAIKAEPPFHLLDFGCGPGRDLQTFTGLGHFAVGLEDSQQAAEIARTKSGCEILVQDFLTYLCQIIHLTVFLPMLHYFISLISYYLKY